MKDVKLEAVDNFINSLEEEYNMILLYMNYLSLTEEDAKIAKDALSIIKKKIKKMQKCHESDLKKHLKVNQIYQESLERERKSLK